MRVLGGYWHPIGLHRRLNKREGPAGPRRKMLKGEVFFKYNYSYHENRMLKTARVRRGGRDVLLQWDKRGKPPPEQHNAL